MDLNEYQKRAITTASYPNNYKIIYPALGLGNEAGEVLGKIKKWIRGDDGDGLMSEERRLSLRGEIGDVLWYLSVLADDLDFPMNDIAEYNLEKLKSRKERGVIKGDGDER